MAPSSVSPLSVEMCPALGKHRVQPRLEGGLVGVVATTAPSRMGATGHGTVPATRTLMGTPPRGTPPLGCVRVCMCVRGEEEASASIGGAQGGKSEVSYLFGFWSMSKNVKDPTDRHWNMNFFFFSGKLTDEDGKKDNLKALTSSSLA